MTPLQLFAAHRYLVRHVATSLRRKLPMHVATDEIESAALFGLWQACLSFRPGAGASLKTHAQQRMVGAVMDYLRERDRTRRKVYRAEFLSLDTLLADEDAGNDGEALPARTEPPWRDIQRADLLALCRAWLSPIQGEALRLYYWRGLTHDEIGLELHRTGSAIALMLHSARALLREALVGRREEFE